MCAYMWVRVQVCYKDEIFHHSARPTSSEEIFPCLSPPVLQGSRAHILVSAAGNEKHTEQFTEAKRFSREKQTSFSCVIMGILHTRSHRWNGGLGHRDENS